MEFKKGDRVTCTGKGLDPYGLSGTVVHIGKVNIVVEFDENFIGGHVCAGRTKSNRGWYLYSDQLEPERIIKVRCTARKTSEDFFTVGREYLVTNNGMRIIDDYGDKHGHSDVLFYFSDYYEFEPLDEYKPFNCVFYVTENIGNFKKDMLYRIENGRIKSGRRTKIINNMNELYSVLGQYVVATSIAPLIVDGKLNCKIRITKSGTRHFKPGDVIEIVKGRFKSPIGMCPFDEELKNIDDLDFYFSLKDHQDNFNSLFGARIDYELI